jgi:pyrimidine-nucleoside phosphorylase
MVKIGTDAGRRMVALISDMNQPLGHAIGNALEVKEAIATLRGEAIDGIVVPPGFWEHAVTVAAHMLVLAGSAVSLAEARELVIAARDRGDGLEKFRQMVAAQGGDVAQVDHPERLPNAKRVEQVTAQRSGYVARIDAGALGWAAVRLGAGRAEKGAPIDHAVGFVVPVKVGDRLEAGDPLATIHAQEASAVAEAQEAIRAAIALQDEPVEPLPLFYGLTEAA